jgi:hypothetical protein
MAKSGRQLRRVKAALERLTQPVRKDSAPLLDSYEQLPDGRLRVQVGKAWMPRLRFSKVAWPLPTKGATSTTLALYLYVFGPPQLPQRVAELAERMGIKAKGLGHQRDEIRRALKAINKHLRAIEAPDWFQLKRLPGDTISIMRLGDSAEVRAYYDAKPSKLDPDEVWARQCAEEARQRHEEWARMQRAAKRRAKAALTEAINKNWPELDATKTTRVSAHVRRQLARYQ